MSELSSRSAVEQQIQSRLRVSKYIQRSLLGVALAAGLTAGPSEGLGKDPVAAIAWTAAAGSIAAAAIERPLAVRRCRRFVRNYAAQTSSDGLVSELQAVFPVVLSEVEGELQEKPKYDKAADEDVYITSVATRSIARGSTTAAAFMAGYLGSRTASGEVTNGMEPLLYGLGGVMLACTVAVEVADRFEQTKLVSAFGRQLDNIDRGPAFEAGA